MRGVDISSPGVDRSSENSEPPAVERVEAPPRCAPRSRVDLASEEAALDCWRRGDRERALRILMTAYGARVFAYALRMLRNRELAEDIRQEVFIAAFKQLDTYEARGTLWSWLCGIARHRCLDELKHSWHKKVEPQDTAVLDELYEASAHLESPSRIAKQRALEACLGKLPGAMRAQTLMRYFFGLSDAEIGTQVGDKAGTVQRRFARILPRLRRCLHKKGAV